MVAPGVHVPLVTLSGGLAEIYDSSVGPDGNLYFAGNFDAVDGAARHNVAAVNATTGALVTSFVPSAGSANAVLATASAIYVGTGKLLSFQLNGTPTPGYSAPVAIIDASLRGHTTEPQFRDIQLRGSTLVAACQCDSLTDSVGTRLVRAVVEVDAATGNWVNWVPSGLALTGPQPSGAFGVNVIVHAFPGTGAPTVYLAAGGSDFTAAYDFSTGHPEVQDRHLRIESGHRLVPGNARRRAVTSTGRRRRGTPTARTTTARTPGAITRRSWSR